MRTLPLDSILPITTGPRSSIRPPELKYSPFKGTFLVANLFINRAEDKKRFVGVVRASSDNGNLRIRKRRRPIGKLEKISCDVDASVRFSNEGSLNLTNGRITLMGRYYDVGGKNGMELVPRNKDSNSFRRPIFTLNHIVSRVKKLSNNSDISQMEALERYIREIVRNSNHFEELEMDEIEYFEQLYGVGNRNLKSIRVKENPDVNEYYSRVGYGLSTFAIEPNPL